MFKGLRSQRLMALFASHPSMEERIAALSAQGR